MILHSNRPARVTTPYIEPEGEGTNGLWHPPCKGHRLKLCEGRVRFKTTQGWCLKCWTKYTPQQREQMLADHQAPITQARIEQASATAQLPHIRQVREAEYDNYWATVEQ